MAYEGMVHALEEIHRLLSPAGVLIDIHPVNEGLHVEIHNDGRVELVGDLSVRQWCTDFEQADLALAEVTDRGMFTVEHHRLFDSLIHYGSAAEMRADFSGSIDRFARDSRSADEARPLAEAMVLRAEETMGRAAGRAELITRERTHISRLKPA
jgi:hypothetical protein